MQVHCPNCRRLTFVVAPPPDETNHPTCGSCHRAFRVETTESGSMIVTGDAIYKGFPISSGSMPAYTIRLDETTISSVEQVLGAFSDQPARMVELPPEMDLASMERRLQTFVRKEQYEQAAMLRDKIASHKAEFGL